MKCRRFVSRYIVSCCYAMARWQQKAIALRLMKNANIVCIRSARALFRLPLVCSLTKASYRWMTRSRIFFRSIYQRILHPTLWKPRCAICWPWQPLTRQTAYDWNSPDFVAAFFDNRYPKHKPGTIFHYNTAGTVALCGIVEKLAGKPMLDYMRPLLDEIGFSKDAWCIQTPEGRSWTGSGILCTSRDLAKFGLLCLYRGAWNGKQLVSREYMEAATSYQIDTTVSDSKIAGPVWLWLSVLDAERRWICLLRHG